MPQKGEESRKVQYQKTDKHIIGLGLFKILFYYFFILQQCQLSPYTFENFGFIFWANKGFIGRKVQRECCFGICT